MKDFLQKYAHWLVFGIFAFWTVLECLPPSARSGEMDYDEFGTIPVQSDGRVKPLDTVARTELLLISNQQEFRDEKDRKQPAIRWLLDVMSAGHPANSLAGKYKVFRIDYDQVLEFLGLPKRPGFYRYSYAEIAPTPEAFEKLKREHARVSDIPDDKRGKNLFDQKIYELGNRVARYRSLVSGHSPEVVPPHAQGAPWFPMDRINEMVFDHFVMPRAKDAEDHVRKVLLESMQKNKLDPDKLTPDQKEGFERMVQDETRDVLRELFEKQRERASPSAAAFANILDAYRSGDAKAFHEAIVDYRANHLKTVPDTAISDSRKEAFLNRLTPFYLAMVMYIVAGVLAAGSWLYWPETLRKSALWLAVLAGIIQTAALLLRMEVMNRPFVFVTNLYSSAVFIGWGCVGIGLILELIFRNSIGITVGAVLGAISNFIAHHLLADGDTLATLEPVLDTNFWLATHVTMVTLGYVATLVAGMIGLAYIILGVFTPLVDRVVSKTLNSMQYGVLCFATFLSFTGTILGGIWADQSWGRFWGWDPKENGAVLVVIWNALILHARWGGMVKQRGMAVLSLVGFMITFWSWFGTNQLGVGLHAYGFSNKLAVLCLVAWGTMLVMIGIGLTPLRYWSSVKAQKAATAAAAAVAKASPHPGTGKGKKQVARTST